MRVCIVTTAFPRWPQDGRGTFILDAARAVQARGARVKVIAMHSPGAKTREVIDGIEVIRPRYLWPERLEVLQKEGGGLPIMWRTSYLARLALMPFSIVHTSAIARHAAECDVIHANWTLSATAAWVARVWRRRPLIVTVHGSDIYQATRLPFVGRLTRALLHRCERVIAVSHSLAQAVIALGLPQNHVEVVPDGIDIDRFRPPSQEREPLLLFVGSLIERKGLRHLIRAMPDVLGTHPEYRLAIVGDGPQLPELRQLAQSVEVADRIDFVGAQTPSEVSRWMQRARLFVLPSVEEGLGVVLLEALACGTPCVAARVGGIPDLISTEVGLLVPPAEPTALVQAITTLLNNPDRWLKLSYSARSQVVERYSWSVIASRLMQIYQTTMNSTTAEGRR